MINVFCITVPEKAYRNARPITIPGMVFVTRATLSMIFLSFLFTVLLAVISAEAKAIIVPTTAVATATRMEFTYTP